MKAKKLLSILCSLAMVASMGMAAFAEETEGSKEVTEASSENIDVTLEATMQEITHVYNVDITWTNMTFVYTENAPKQWTASSHSWSTANGQWNQGSATITVTNHSSAAVRVTGTYAKEGADGYESDTPKDGVTVSYQSFTKDQLEEGTSENLSTPGNNRDTATVSVSGTPTKSITSAVVGKITVKIETNLEP